MEAARVIEFESLRLIDRIRGGSEQDFEALVKQMQPQIRFLVNKYFGPGLTREDVAQEALIGLYKATWNYDGSTSLSHFAFICMERHVASAVKTSKRGKHSPLSNYASIDPETEHLVATHDATSHTVITRDLLAQVLELIRSELTSIELNCLVGFLAGKTYRQIADENGLTAKAVDNALQRMKRKLTNRVSGIPRRRRRYRS